MADNLTQIDWSSIVSDPLLTECDSKYNLLCSNDDANSEENLVSVIKLEEPIDSIELATDGVQNELCVRTNSCGGERSSNFPKFPVSLKQEERSSAQQNILWTAPADDVYVQLFDCQADEKLFTKSFVYLNKMDCAQCSIGLKREKASYLIAETELRLNRLRDVMHQKSSRKFRRCTLIGQRCSLQQHWQTCCFNVEDQQHQIDLHSTRRNKTPVNQPQNDTPSTPIQRKTLVKVGHRYRCDHCNLTFASTGSLNNHRVRFATNEPPSFKCPVCEKVFSRIGNMQRHLMTHSDKKLHTCTLCTKSYSRSDRLRAHYKDKHPSNSNKPVVYECEVAGCGKSFCRADVLALHMTSHSDETPFECKYCGSKWKLLSSLKDHIFQHTGLWPFMCVDCGKGYRSRAALMDHMNVHTNSRPYKCAECDKTFTSLHAIRMHSIVHSDRRPYKCGVCDKTFARCSDYTKHRQSVHKSHKFSGNKCSRTFFPRLRKHLKRHVTIGASKLFNSTKLRTSCISTELSGVNTVNSFTCADCNATFASEPDFEVHSSNCHLDDQLASSQFASDDVITDETRQAGDELPQFTECPTDRGEDKCDVIVGRSLSSDCDGPCLKSNLCVETVCVENNALFSTKQEYKSSLNVGHTANGGHPDVYSMTSVVTSGAELESNDNQTESAANRKRRRSLTCPYCNRVLSSSSKLVVHIRVHTGDRPFHCTTCTKTFIRKDCLTRHTRSVHAEVL